jgi:hypothetical protein
MKMLMLVYSGSNPQRISRLIDDHEVGGYMEFSRVRGSGSTGRREGTRAWPGESTLFVSVAPEEQADELLATLRGEVGRLPAGERLHVAVLPAESFF